MAESLRSSKFTIDMVIVISQCYSSYYYHDKPQTVSAQ